MKLWIEEINRGLKARMDGTGRRMSEEGLTEAKVQQTEKVSYKRRKHAPQCGCC